MDEYNKYDALARTTNMEDIASCEHNREIFRRLKENDPEFVRMRIYHYSDADYSYDFYPGNGEELGWLGYFMGGNTTLQRLPSGQLSPHLATLELRISAEGWDETGRSENCLSVTIDWTGTCFKWWILS